MKTKSTPSLLTKVLVGQFKTISIRENYKFNHLKRKPPNFIEFIPHQPNYFHNLRVLAKEIVSVYFVQNQDNSRFIQF